MLNPYEAAWGKYKYLSIPTSEMCPSMRKGNIFDVGIIIEVCSPGNFVSLGLDKAMLFEQLYNYAP